MKSNFSVLMPAISTHKIFIRKISSNANHGKLGFVEIGEVSIENVG